jgi:hypothetical protein
MNKPSESKCCGGECRNETCNEAGWIEAKAKAENRKALDEAIRNAKPHGFLWPTLEVGYWQTDNSPYGMSITKLAHDPMDFMDSIKKLTKAFKFALVVVMLYMSKLRLVGLKNEQKD